MTEVAHVASTLARQLAPPTTREEIGSLPCPEATDDDDHQPTNHTESTIERYRDCDPGQSVYGHSHQYRLPPEEPAYTITSSNRHFHPKEPRFVTAREQAILQSFPMNFSFSGTLSSKQKQIGNAVPPGLARAIGASLLDSLGR